ncbi:MAG: nucleotide sugar dehydrogenase [Candidatus Poseidoniales archaeon]|nr:nucleotide sugar dehydrogenase [Candidatus Poseidoniales archaeon]
MGWGSDFSARVASRDLTIGVIGLGYVGLPTALGFHDAGFRVRAVDVNEQVVARLEAGENPGDDPQHDDLIPAAQSDDWRVSTSYRDTIPDCDVVLVTVPTPVNIDLTPDLSFVRAAGASVFGSLPKGARTVVVLESTVYPGVTRELWGGLLAELELEEGVDVELAYCPERFVPGDPEHGVRQVPRVVGATNEHVGEGLAELYDTLTSGGVTYVGAIEVAEAAKVVENVQRDLNIALVNELARIFPSIGIDVEDVLSAAATKWNFHRYHPGIGVGGHCIPVDPYYLIQRAAETGTPAELISAARAVNRSMPANVASDIRSILAANGVVQHDARILLLGWSYKPGIADARETPAEPLAQALRTSGMSVEVWDPYVDPAELPVDLVSPLASPFESAGFDMAVVVTAHDEVCDLDWAALAEVARHPLLYDGRRVLDVDAVAQAGWKLYLLGSPF